MHSLGVTHMDLRPQNLMLLRKHDLNDHSSSLVVIDFNVSHPVDVDHLNHDAILLAFNFVARNICLSSLLGSYAFWRSSKSRRRIYKTVITSTCRPSPLRNGYQCSLGVSRRIGYAQCGSTRSISTHKYWHDENEKCRLALLTVGMLLSESDAGR